MTARAIELLGERLGEVYGARTRGETLERLSRRFSIDVVHLVDLFRLHGDPMPRRRGRWRARRREFVSRLERSQPPEDQ